MMEVEKKKIEEKEIKKKIKKKIRKKILIRIKKVVKILEILICLYFLNWQVLIMICITK
jgi:hypothetical protein